MSPAISTSAWCWKTSCGVRVVAAISFLSVGGSRSSPSRPVPRKRRCRARIGRRMNEPSAALTYTSYLALEEVLAARRPKTDEHDEMLFIVIHQVYELWFKQLLHELRHLQQRLEAGEGARAPAPAQRVLALPQNGVGQIDVVPTMTP